MKKKLKKQDRNVSTSLDYSNINYYKIYNKTYIIITVIQANWHPTLFKYEFFYFQFQSHFDMHFMTVYMKVWS